MKDYTPFIAAAYLLTAVVLLGLCIHSIVQARAAAREAEKFDA